MEKSTHIEHLETIKKSIVQVLQSNAKKDSAETFIVGYNALYQFCTNDLPDKYTIEGEEIYQMYIQILSRYLEQFPSDYTLETLALFMYRYRKSNERVCKMLSFLTRYFIRINIETSNPNIQSLKKVHSKKIFDALFKENARKIYGLFAKKFTEYINGHGNMGKSLEAKTYWHKQLKVLQLFFREQIKILDSAEQRKSIKRFCEKMVQLLLEEDSSFKDSLEKSKNRYSFFYQRIALINTLFAQKDRKKKIFYSALAKKIEPTILQEFMTNFVSVMLRKPLGQKTYRELNALYDFVDYSAQGRKAFSAAFLCAIVKVFRRSTECSHLIRFLIFIKQHLLHMPRVDKKTKITVEMVFVRHIRGVLGNEKDILRFENAILDSIHIHEKKSVMHTKELSLFVANIPAERSLFWKRFIIDMKYRLLTSDDVGYEKSLIINVIRRIERYRGFEIKQEIDAPQEIVDYIDFSTLYNEFSLYDINNFEEILLCIRDIATSEMHFKREGIELSTDCRLLAYTRWDCPTMDISIPCELENLWIEVQRYCQEKGRKFQLNLCPTISSVTLEINNSVVLCDLLQATIIIFLGKTGPLQIEKIISSILSNPSDENRQVFLQRLSSLVNALVVVNNGGLIMLNNIELPDKIDIFTLNIEKFLLEKTVEHTSKLKNAIEAFVIYTVKYSSGIETSVIEKLAKEKFSISKQELHVHVSTLQQKGFILQKDSALFYLP